MGDWKPPFPKPPMSRKDTATLLSRQESSASSTPDAQDHVSTLEESIATRPSFTPPTTSKALLQKIIPKQLSKKTVAPIIIVFALLFGGGSFLAMIFSPAIPLLQFVETLSKDLNSQLAGMDKTNSQLMRAKLKSTTAGSCGVVKIACRFKTVNIEKTKEAYSGSGIEIEFDTDKGFGAGRGKIKKMTYTNPRNPADTITINSADDYTRAMKTNQSFRTASINVKNPKFLSLKNSAAIKFLGKIKTSYAKKLNGKNTKELDDDVEKASGGKTPLHTPKLVAEKDENGKETGNYIDEDGKVYSPDEAKNLIETENRITSAPKTSNVIDEVAKGASIAGIADTACTVYNTSRAVSFAAKTVMATELARYAMIWLNTSSSMMAGDASPEQVEYVGKKLTETDLRKTVTDESKLDTTLQGQPLPMADNPSYKKSGLDATFYKQSAYQDKPTIDLSAQRFVIGGGLVGTLSGVNFAIAKAVGAKNPSELSKKCKLVQNPAVRGGSLIVGVLAGVGSFGLATAFSLAGSAALGMALPYLVSQLGDIVAGRVTGPELTGVDMANATAVGTSVLLNGIAHEQGMIPMPADKMTDYQNINRETEIAYAKDEYTLAQDTPFDIYNKYSFLGSLSRKLIPVSQTITSKNTIDALAVMPRLLALSTSSFSPKATAFVSTKIKQERYEQCPDETYKEMNMAADTSCSLLFGLPKEAMEADPVEVAEWMAANDEIDPESEDGSAKDNKQDWNYKKFIEKCIDQQPGAYQDLEKDPSNGYECVDPQNYEKNWHYAKYTVSKNWNDVLDGEIPGISGGSKTDFSSGDVGEVNSDGWAYPTTADAEITSPFGMRNGSPHNGIDLAQPGGAMGKPIFAARDGEVIASGPAEGFGQWIVIRHEVDGKRVDTVYGHMYPEGVFVKQGDKVKAGQEIAKIGNNGQSTGPHLHFEIWDNGHSSLGGSGKPIDPAEIIKKSQNSTGDNL